MTNADAQAYNAVFSGAYGPYVDSAAIARAYNYYWAKFYENVYKADTWLKRNLDTSELDLNDPAVAAMVDQVEQSLGSLIIEMSKTYYIDFGDGPFTDMTSNAFMDHLNKTEFVFKWNDPTLTGGQMQGLPNGYAEITIDLGDIYQFNMPTAQALNFVFFHELGHSHEHARFMAEMQMNEYRIQTGQMPDDNYAQFMQSNQWRVTEGWANSLGREMADIANTSWAPDAIVNADFGGYAVI